MMGDQRRARGTGCVTQRGDGYWIAIAPQHRRGEKQFRVATRKTRTGAGEALDAWLTGSGCIRRKAS